MLHDIRYHRLTDWNYSINALPEHTSFEAGFYVGEEKELILQGRIVDSTGKEIFRSGDLRDSIGLERYQQWDPRTDLSHFMAAIDSQKVDQESTHFHTPMLELSLEVWGPIATSATFRTVITMSSRFTVLGQYIWTDSSPVSIPMLCCKDALLGFAQGLLDDLKAMTED